MGKAKGKGKEKSKKVEETVEEPKKGRGNPENLTPKEKVIIPDAILKKIKKNKPEVYQIIMDLEKAREAGDDGAQRKARLALRKKGFYLSKLEKGEDPFLTEDEAKEKKSSKKSKKVVEDDDDEVEEEEVEEEEEDDEEEEEDDDVEEEEEEDDED